MRKFLIIASVATIVSLFGCVENQPGGNSTVPAVGTSIDKAHAHVDSAENVNQRIKPHADATGKELVNVASDEHKAAGKELDDAKRELVRVQTERDNLAKQAASNLARALKAEHSFGYRAEQWVIRFLVLLSIALAVHILAGALAVGLPAIFPAAEVAVPALKVVGAIFNPGAWYQFVCDHIHLGRCKASKATVVIVPSGAITA